METLEVSRVVDATEDDLAALMTDLVPFMRAAGFDEVSLDGDELTIKKSVGLLRISLDLELFETADAVLAYRQQDGIFEEMTTWYYLDEHEDGIEVSARTDFALGAPGGSLLDSTIIRRQRRRELEAQFEYLQSNT